MTDAGGDPSNNQSRLARAVTRGEHDVAKQLLDSGTDPNGPYRITLLHHAVRRGDLEMVRLLTTAGANLESTSRDGWTALARADADGEADIVAQLLSAGADPKSQQQHGFNELHRAARLGDLDRCRLALRTGIDVDARSADGSTALLLAAKLCDTEASAAILTELLESHADPNIPDNDGWTPLASAAYEDAAHANISDDAVLRVPLLLRSGADPNAGSYPPLLAAISQEGQCWAVNEALIRAGADPDVTDDQGTTILHRAVQVGHDGEFIVRCAAVVSNGERRDKDGKSAADFALENWDPEPEDDEQLDRLLALCVASADLSLLRGVAPDWLVAEIGQLGVDAPPHYQTRFASLQQIFLETKASLGR